MKLVNQWKDSKTFRLTDFFCLVRVRNRFIRYQVLLVYEYSVIHVIIIIGTNYNINYRTVVVLQLVQTRHSSSKCYESIRYRKENLIGSYNIKNQNNPGNICKPVNQNLANGKPILPQQGTHPYQVTYACHVCMPRYMPRMNACMKKLYIFSGIFIFSETG